MSAISVEKMGTIDVGRQGENLARTIEFDVSTLLKKWPDATITLLVKRKGDTDPYFAEATVADGILRWPITKVETAVVGDGKIEIQVISGDVIAKSVTATIRVSASLSGSASTELPEIYPSWVDQVLNGAGESPGGGSVALDTTLSVAGMAADAAAVGEIVTALSEEMAKKDKPLVYIDGEIPTTKDNVLATMTVKSKWLNIFAYIKIKCQGSSSMNYAKKNFTVTLYQDEARTIPLEITIPGWKHASNKFVFKANYIDHLHARNIISARLWSEIVASRPDYDNLPDEFRNSPNNGAVDGFPIVVYTNGAYQGIYTWNIGKDAWMWGMNEDNPNHVLLCAETNTNGSLWDTPCNFRALWSGVHEEYWSVEVGTNSDSVKNALNALIACVKDTTDDEFMAQIETYLDVQSAIDYYLFSCANLGIDNLGKNMLLGTYGLRKWMLGQYDLDSTWGLWWDGSKFIPASTACPGGYQEAFSLLFERIVNCYKPRLVSRGFELRNTVLSVANINAHFERFSSEIGKEAYADDLVPYPNIPSAEDNDIWQIRNFVKERLAYFDSWLESMVEVDYDTPYPLKDGIYSYVDPDNSANTLTMAITNGSHVAIDLDMNEASADFTKGLLARLTSIYKYDDKLFALKQGDVVTRKLKNIVVTGDFADKAKYMTVSLYGANGEVKFNTNNIALHLVENGSDIEDTITITEDVDIGSVILWIGGSAAVIEDCKIEFDVLLYVNGERYI